MHTGDNSPPPLLLSVAAVSVVIGVSYAIIASTIDPAEGLSASDARIPLLVGVGLGLILGGASAVLLVRHPGVDRKRGGFLVAAAAGIGILIANGSKSLLVGTVAFCAASGSFLIAAWAVVSRRKRL